MNSLNGVCYGQVQAKVSPRNREITIQPRLEISSRHTCWVSLP